MAYVLVVAGLLVCAVQAVRAQRLLFSALWLAGASALTALLMYLMGAPEVAVIELSVGAGLVTVLFVFAINIAGEEGLGLPSIVPRPLAGLLVVGSALLIGWMNLDVLGIQIMQESGGFSNVVWGDRQLDVFLQIVLIFAGVLGVLGLLAEIHPSSTHASGTHEAELAAPSAQPPLPAGETVIDAEVYTPSDVLEGA